MIGTISLKDLEVKGTHKASLGYWLARPYWGKGITTRATRVLTEYAFKTLGLVRIEALVDHRNEASAKVLRNAGFIEEGFCRKYVKMGDHFQDTKIFGKVI